MDIESTILEKYIEFILEHGEHPKSIYKFCKDIEIEEKNFYDYFTSFNDIENSFFEMLFANTISVLNENDDYLNSDSQTKLLSFYFTFFENLTMNRSFVLKIIEDSTKQNQFKAFKKLKKHFINYVNGLQIVNIDLKQEQLEKLKDKVSEESLWFQFLLTMKFWRDDTSKGFEKTDIYIEKSINTTFELINTSPVKSLIDFGKFIYNEKFKQN